MSPHNPRVTKEQAEEAIFARFADAYAQHYGASLLSPIHRERPDFAAVDASTGQTLGVEVTGAYQDDREAEINYWLSRNWAYIEGNFDLLITAINERLADKSAKSGSYDRIGPLLLAIWLGSFLFHHKTEVKLIAPSLVIPANSFSLIALIITDDAGQKPLLHILQETPGWRTRGAA